MPSLYAVMSEEKNRQSERIRKLQEENEQLKQRNQELFDDLQNKTSWLSLRGGELVILKRENEQLKQLLDYADDLIQSHLSEHYIRQWRNFKTGHKEYNDFWEEKLKKHKELKEDME